MRSILFRQIFFLFLLLFFPSCQKTRSEKTTKPIVLVSIAPYAGFIEKIAGNTLDVQTLIPQGVNLHTYEPTPKNVEAASKAVLWFRIDEPLEVNVSRALKETNPALVSINLQKNISLIYGDESKSLNPCGGTGHTHSGADLHTWMSPSNVTIQIRDILETLVSMFPEHEMMYKINGRALIEEVDALNQHLKLELAPFRGDAILVSHPALGYFCRDYQLIQLSVECEGKEPGPKDIEKILSQTKNYRIRCGFMQKGFDDRGIRLIASQMKIPLYSLDPYARDYFMMIQTLANEIAQ